MLDLINIHSYYCGLRNMLTILQVPSAVALSTMLEMPYFEVRSSTFWRSVFSATLVADRTIVTVVTCHICCFSVTEYAILYTGFSHSHILSIRQTCINIYLSSLCCQMGKYRVCCPVFLSLIHLRSLYIIMIIIVTFTQ